ncbi:hypothetical protein Zmor_020219 [Zophobas morio]|uniref:Uncharacterized protein n=1 Tax=Zophobas morio TaxID=2755281 RepID=A0AA38M9R8_9CUCU|nr:hypothetical protein Zmor_020219 [Zophobas morio]
MKLPLLLVFITLFKPQVLGSTIEDAEQALQDLEDLNLLYQGELHLHMNNQSDILRGQLMEMQTQTQQEILDQVNNILSKISTMAENTQTSTGANVDNCLSTANEDLADFANEMSDRLNDCYGSMLDTGNYMLYTSWSKVWDEYDLSYRCAKMGFEECKNYGNEGCPDDLISGYEYSKEYIEQAFTALKTDMVNQITGMNYPCRQMILEEMALYPSLILNYVGLCLEIINAPNFMPRC